jgi:hypothetical protein
MRPLLRTLSFAAAGLVSALFLSAWSESRTGSDEAGMELVKKYAADPRMEGAQIAPEWSAAQERWLFAGQAAAGAALFSVVFRRMKAVRGS